MIKIENVVTPSPEQWEAVIRGVRNPFNSWTKSDTKYTDSDYDKHTITIGKNDLTLMNRLANAGDDHGKFMRMLPVIVGSLKAPLYFWKQLDTYKIGTVADSCSTMHMLTARPFEHGDFSFDYCGEEIENAYMGVLNRMWEHWNDQKDEEEKKKIWYMINELLPNCYNQVRTWSANYQTLKHIYHARKNHKLKEWHDFCDWIETLPYAKELIIGEME